MASIIRIPTSDWGQCVDKVGSDEIATLACIPVVLQNVINALVGFAGIVALFFIVFSGIRLVTSQGDPQKIDSARKTFLYAVFGLLFILLSFVILNLTSIITGVKELAPR